jgi:hypothetical protein
LFGDLLPKVIQEFLCCFREVNGSAKRVLGRDWRSSLLPRICCRLWAHVLHWKVSWHVRRWLLSIFMLCLDSPATFDCICRLALLVIGGPGIHWMFDRLWAHQAPTTSLPTVPSKMSSCHCIAHSSWQSAQHSAWFGNVKKPFLWTRGKQTYLRVNDEGIRT